MATTIALAGKGGVGKTTLAALVIKYLILNQAGAILAIDADPSSNLNMVLGLDLEWTVGDIREDMLSQVKESIGVGGAAMGSLPGGITKRDYLDYQIRTTLAEGDRVDLIAMGRSEGPGCYCAVNHNLREVVDSLSNNYSFVVIDNEAGMEHLSRRTTRDVDHLIIVSDPSQRGMVAAERIAEFSKDLDINIRNTYLVINRAPAKKLPVELEKTANRMEIPLIGVIPSNGELMEFEFSGRPIVEVDEQSPVFTQVVEIMKRIL
jgi:CO dehydrogenase maturation factor